MKKLKEFWYTLTHLEELSTPAAIILLAGVMNIVAYVFVSQI